MTENKVCDHYYPINDQGITLPCEFCQQEKEHQCNEDSTVYIDTEGMSHIFHDSNEAAEWYEENYETVRGGSVACSICGRDFLDMNPGFKY
jgi:ribosomal protein S27AE